jgi:mucin-19
MPSLVQVSESNAIVYISSSSVFSDLMTIRDIAGDRSTSNTITISTRSGLLFAGGTYTQTLDTPYASLTVNPSTGQIVHKFPFTYGQSVDLDSLTSLGHLDLNVPTLLSNSLYIANSISSFGGIDASTILIRGNVVNTRPELISTILNLGQVYTSSLYVPIDSLQSNGFTVSSNLLSTVGGALPYISTQEFQSTLYSSLSNFVMQSNMTSTIDGLGSSGFISKAGLISTVQGLGTAGYISSSWFISTVSSMQADINKPAGTWFYISTNAGLANSGYISTSQLTSTVEGLGQLYISSAILSTVSFLSGYDIGFFTKTLLGPGFLSNPTGVAVDTSGNIYVADTNNNMIRRIDTTGAVTVYAGSSNAGSANGPASNATFNGPRGIAVDSTGVYVADTGNNLIRYISGGIVSTYAGTSAVGSSNGAASNATFNGPRGIAIDSTGLYVADTGNNLIRQIINSNVTTLAGTGSAGSADGSLASASFNSPVDVEVSFGIVYVADRLNSKIRQISLAGVTTIASNFSPTVLAYSPGSNILYAFDTNNVLRQVLPTLSIITGSTQGFVDGSRTVASFNSPSGLAVDSSGNIYVGDSGNNSIRKVMLAPPINLVSTVQGLGSIYITKQALITAVQDATVSLAPLPATVTRVSTQQINPVSLALDSSGNFYYTEPSSNVIYKLNASGISILAGSTLGFANGQGSNAKFYDPYGVAVYSGGIVYVGDFFNHVIRKIDINSNVTTFAGSNKGFADGQGTAARFDSPRGVAVDSSGFIYVADSHSHRIRKISPSGAVTTLGGNGNQGFANGQGTAAQFFYPYGVAVDSAGNVYVGDTGNDLIRKIDRNSNVTTLAGIFGSRAFADGPGIAARFFGPSGIAVDLAGNIYVADAFNNRIRKIDRSSNVTTYFTTSINNYAVAVDSSGNVYAPSEGRILSRVTPPQPAAGGFVVPSELISTNRGLGNYYISTSGLQSTLNSFGPGAASNLTSSIDGLLGGPQTMVTTLAGSTQGFANGQGTAAQFSGVRGVAVDSAGIIYVADESNRIRKIDRNSNVTTLAGSGVGGYNDAQGINAQFNVPTGIAVDSGGNVYVGEEINNRIRKISPSGNVTTLAGSTSGFSNAQGTAAQFNQPRGVAVDSAGNVYVADTGNHQIRKISPSGNVTSLAGSTIGYNDAQGTAAQFNLPFGVAVDSAGIIYVADLVNNRIRKIDTNSNVTTLAGSTQGFANGQGTAAQFYTPSGVAVDSAGIIYVADTTNNRIRKIDRSSNVTTLAGSAQGCNNGPGTSAQFYNPYGVAVDSAGSVYVADYYNFRIRNITTVTTSSLYTSQSMLTTACDNLGQQYLSTINLTITGYQTPSNYFTALSNQVVQYSNMVANMVTAYYASSLSNSSYSSIPQIPADTTQVPLPGFATYTAEPIYNIGGAAMDSAGNIYFSNPGSNSIYAGNIYPGGNNIFKIDSSGTISLYAGVGGAPPTSYGTNNGQGTNARFFNPLGVAVDSVGNVYVADSFNGSIRKISPSRDVITLSASLNYPIAITIDSIGNIYVAEYYNHIISKIDVNSNRTTYAGTIGSPGFINGLSMEARFKYPSGVTVDLAGNVYVADIANSAIRKIDLNSNVTTFIGGIISFPVGGSLFNPYSLTIDSASNIYVNTFNGIYVTTVIPGGASINDTRSEPTANGLYANSILKIDRYANITLLANGSGTGANGQGSAIFLDSSGKIYIPTLKIFGVPQTHIISKITVGTPVPTVITNATTTAIASLPAYPTITSSNVTTNIQSNTVAIYSGGYISSSKYLAVNPTSLSLSNLYSFCNVRANAFYASNADGTNGQFFADGTLLTSTSDRRLKREIVRMSNAIDKIQALSGVYYTRNDDPSHQRRVGFIAQEVEAVFPDLVFTDSSQMNYKSIKYESIGVALLEAIKELDIQCDELLSTIV